MENKITQKNLDTLKSWVDAINNNNIEAELSYWQPDGEFTIVPLGVTFKGIDEIRLGGQNSASLIGDQPVEGRKQITHLSGGETWATVEYDVLATINGPLKIGELMLIPEGERRDVVTKTCVVFLMKEGKLWRGQEYFDTTAMAEQLGLSHEMLSKIYASMSK